MLMRERHFVGGSTGTVDATTLDGGRDIGLSADQIIKDLRDGDPKKPSMLDKHIGKQIRKQRRALKMSQEDLGKRLGLTFQQVQKYEKGTNRCGAARLYQIAHELGVPLMLFFPDYEQPTVKADVLTLASITQISEQIRKAGTTIQQLKSRLLPTEESDHDGSE